MVLENGLELSTTQLRKRIKTLMKADEVMNGSGRLFLHENQCVPLSEEAVKGVQERIISALREAGISGFEEGKIRFYIASILRQIALPERGAAPGKKKKKKGKSKNKAKQAQKQQKQSHQMQQQRRGARREVRTVTVIVKKARTFHYPRDLPMPGTGDKS